MFKILRKSEYNELHKQLHNKHHKQIQLETLVEDYQKLIELKNEEIKSLTEKAEKLSKALEEANSDKNRVTLVISDDMTTVTPFVATTPDVFEHLFHANMLTDAEQDNKHSHELALMVIALEALGQIVDSFTQPVKD